MESSHFITLSKLSELSNIVSNFSSKMRCKQTLQNKRCERKITQCTDIHTAIAFALIRLGKISGRRRLGTGPAPRANVNTNLHKFYNQGPVSRNTRKFLHANSLKSLFQWVSWKHTKTISLPNTRKFLHANSVKSLFQWVSRKHTKTISLLNIRYTTTKCKLQMNVTRANFFPFFGSIS